MPKMIIRMDNRKPVLYAVILFMLLSAGMLTGCGSRQEDSFLLEETAGEAMESGALETEAAPLRADALAQAGALSQADALAQAGALPQTDTLPQSGTLSQTGEGSAEETAQTEQTCVVHICGAVQSPGVYKLPAGSRIIDAVEAGGGFLPEADDAACNLAQQVTDGCRIYIMTREESSLLKEQLPQAGLLTEALPGAGITDAKAEAFVSEQPADKEKVNLNTADAALLQTLPGIGASRAADIIAWREANGRFDTIEDIMKVSGIKQAAFEKLKDRITV